MALTDPTTGDPHATPCEQDPEAWFPGIGDKAHPARRGCAACPAKAACLEFALEREWGTKLSNRYGIWGGMSPTERYKLERTMR